MIIFELSSWWFTTGWLTFIQKIGNNFSSLADFFSISSLIRTLFQPYRQISAGKASSDASLELKFHAFTDRLVSRCVGFVSRLFLIVIGLILIILSTILGIILIIAWPLIPLAPIIGIILTVSGVII